MCHWDMQNLVIFLQIAISPLPHAWASNYRVHEGKTSYRWGKYIDLFYGQHLFNELGFLMCYCGNDYMQDQDFSDNKQEGWHQWFWFRENLHWYKSSSNLSELFYMWFWLFVLIGVEKNGFRKRGLDGMEGVILGHSLIICRVKGRDTTIYW